MGLPSGKLTVCYRKIHHFPWENSLVKLPEGKPFKNWDSNGIWMGISCDFLGLH
jgi:hypothetical protein